MIDPLIHRRVLGRYRVVRSLAVGGMGIIYLGRSEGAAGFVKPVVIKRVVADFAASDASALDYFIREATILAQLRHPGIVSVVDFGEDDGAYTMVLEYVHGFHLGQWLRFFQRTDSDFPADLAIHVVCQILDALEHAHHLVQPDGSIARVVHRDVTPSNVLVDVDGHVKLADFGIARVSLGDDDKTQSGLLRGKMPYLAPELLHGKAASVSSDVYSAGVMLHELLLGRNDFRSDVPAETVRLVLHAEPTRIEVVRQDVPRGLDAVLARALAKDPKDRYTSARQLREALRALPLPPADVLQRKLEHQAKHDFVDALPDLLGLEPLADRDLAWRTAPTSSRPPPPPFAAGSTTGARRIEGEEILELDLSPTIDAPTRAYGKTGATTEPVIVQTAEPRAGSRTAALVVAALGLVAIAIGVTWAIDHANRGPTTPRFIVVENNEEEGSAPPSPPEVAAPVVVDAGAQADEAPRPRDPEAAAARPETSATSVTRAFAARRGAVRACFERHTLDVAGAPAIEIRFQVGADGRVTQANLSPGGLEGTDVGRCILGVARNTSFGPLDRPVTFTIPVTAARVAR